MSRMTDLVVLIRRATSSWVPPSAERTLSSYKKYLMPSMFCPLIQIGRLRILVLFQSDMTFYATSCCSDNSHYFFSYEGNSAELQGLEMSTFFFFLTELNLRSQILSTHTTFSLVSKICYLICLQTSKFMPICTSTP